MGRIKDNEIPDVADADEDEEYDPIESFTEEMTDADLMGLALQRTRTELESLVEVCEGKLYRWYYYGEPLDREAFEKILRTLKQLMFLLE